MNGDERFNAGLEPADSSKSRNDRRGDLSEHFRRLKAAQTSLEQRGEWRLAREIDDACARWESEEAQQQQQSLPLGEGERSGETVHGQNPQDAEVSELMLGPRTAELMLGPERPVDDDDDEEP